MKVKVQDFNVYDLIQGGAGDGGGTDVDAFVKLLGDLHRLSGSEAQTVCRGLLQF